MDQHKIYSLQSDFSEGDRQKIIESFGRHVSAGKAAFFAQYGMDFVMGYREGPWLYDVTGQKRLYNLHCNGGVFNLGHRHPVLMQTLKEELEHLDIGNHHLMSAARAYLAQQIASTMPDPLQYVVFGVSGGEATDLALKVARGYTQRRKIISLQGGYHGHTGLALQTGDAKYREPFLMGSDEFIQVPFADGPGLAAVLDDSVAAVILETIPATLGMSVADPAYFDQVRHFCDRYGCLLILDEVQSGLGRTGKLWAFEHYGLVPDMIILGKGLSGGIYPISATVLSKKLESIFHKDPFIHISTFGGAELGCKVASKVMELSSDSDFLKHVNDLAETLYTELTGLLKKYPHTLAGIHGKGLMLALEFVHPDLGPACTKLAYDQDLLMIYANNDSRRVQFLPPLTMEKKDIPWIMERLDQVVAQLTHLMMNRGA